MAFQYRTTTGGSSTSANTTGFSAPYWVKLVRSGNTFTGYRSPNGVTWTQQATTTIAMGAAVHVGLALTSHNNSSLCAATFDNVTAPNWPVKVPAPRIDTTLISGGNLVFSGTNGLSGGTFTILSSTNLATPRINWIQIGTGNFDGAGGFSVTNAMNSNETQRFYLLRQP